MKVIIKREDEGFDYSYRYSMPEYYSFENGVKIQDEDITEWVNEVIEDLMKGRNQCTSCRASGNTIVWGERIQETDDPNEDYLEVRVAKGYEEFVFDVDKIQL